MAALLAGSGADAAASSSAPQKRHFLAARLICSAQTGQGRSSESFRTASPVPFIDRHEVNDAPLSYLTLMIAFAPIPAAISWSLRLTSWIVGVFEKLVLASHFASRLRTASY